MRFIHRLGAHTADKTFIYVSETCSGTFMYTSEVCPIVLHGISNDVHGQVIKTDSRSFLIKH